jgi:ADP-ribose pyrophosphatase YjhB (NUDIX family)
MKNKTTATGETPRNPYLTVDIIIEVDDSIVLIERHNGPMGYALPGGFVDYGETVESAAIREAREETGLDVTLVRQFHVYSSPERDPRQHNVTVVFIARAIGEPAGSSDARSAALFPKKALPGNLAFDHGRIVDDYLCDRY